MRPVKALTLFCFFLCASHEALGATEAYWGKIIKKKSALSIHVKTPANMRGTYCLQLKNPEQAANQWLVNGLYVEVAAEITRKEKTKPCLAAEKIKPALYDPARNIIKRSAGLKPQF